MHYVCKRVVGKNVFSHSCFLIYVIIGTMQRTLHLLKAIEKDFIILLIVILMLTNSGIPPQEISEKARVYTSGLEFDFFEWEMDAVGKKISQAALNLPAYLSETKQKQVVLSYLDMVKRLQQLDREIAQIYADPAVKEPEKVAAQQLAEQKELRIREKSMGLLAEAVIQHQLQQVLDEQSLSLGGQIIPPPLYHVTPLPYALIISPRDVIRQDADLSLLPGLRLDQITTVESQIEDNLNVSALIVPVGGIGLYPTMVMSTSDLEWLVEVVAHEWTHNYLTLRPLGLNYMTTPELRTINETTASIAGKELGSEILRRFYPEFYTPPVDPAPSTNSSASAQTPPAEPVFSYNKEMHITRVHADELLAAGKIEEAEAYMEERRQFFWDNGYLIRRLNQAYFAFYGAYADSSGGGAWGEDPVGPLVQEFRQVNSSLADFLNQIGTVTSLEELQQRVDAAKNLPRH